jgi:hypothetical protein
MNERCQAMTPAGEQCKDYATCHVNGIPYCDQHGVEEGANSIVESPSEPRKYKEAGKKSEAA